MHILFVSGPLNQVWEPLFPRILLVSLGDVFKSEHSQFTWGIARVEDQPSGLNLFQSGEVFGSASHVVFGWLGVGFRFPVHVGLASPAQELVRRQR